MNVTSEVGERDGKAYDALIVGAGFAGMFMLHRLRGVQLDVRVIERGGDVGGTWYWNRYPGARCDIESMDYSYQFSEALQQDWAWTERFATQPEILRYANHVADRFDLRRSIIFDSEVRDAVFDERATAWVLHLSSGESLSSRFLIMATGCLSSANVPEFPGLDSFEGASYHTGKWPHTPVNFKGQRVGVIGTGSSGIQAIPLIAEQAARLTVFQRTANYTIPARNAPLDADYVEDIKTNYSEFRRLNSLCSPAFGSRFPEGIGGRTLDASAEQRREQFDFRWKRGGFGFLGGFDDALVDQDANDVAAEYVRERIRAIVKDPEVAERLCPHQVIGCKRICLDTNYYDTFNRSNVELVDVKASPIQRLTRTGLETTDAAFELDSIVFATGFDAMTGTLLGINPTGRHGQELRDKWHAGPRTLLGLMTAGFPNLFMISGPGSPSVLTNMMVSIEQHVNWVADCIQYLAERRFDTIEAQAAAEDDWVEHVNTLAAPTLYPTCNSWYLGANIAGKPRVFMPHIGFPPYVERCKAVAESGYEGFALG